jgi:antibiotic biosynthesis monooxygenase (ABM) superfamily enzyme
MILVIIERKIAEETKTIYNKVIRSMSKGVSSANGYLNAYSYTDEADENHHYLMVGFDCVQNWKNWLNSNERKELLLAIRPMLKEEEKISVLKKNTHS